MSITRNPLAHRHFGVKWTMFCTFYCLPALNMSKAHCQGKPELCAILLEAISTKTDHIDKNLKFEGLRFLSDSLSLQLASGFTTAWGWLWRI